MDVKKWIFLVWKKKKKKKNRAALPHQELPRVLQFQNWKTLFSLSSSSASYAVYQAVLNCFVMLFLLCECKFESLDGQHL